MNQEKIGKFIAELRKKKGYTQEQLAEALGVTNRSVSRWENGKNMPDISLFQPLCNQLDITVKELLDGEASQEEDAERMSAESIIAYGGYLKRKARMKLMLLSLIVVIALMISSVSVVLVTNKTFLSGAYHSEFCDNVTILIPRFSYYRRTAGDEVHIVTLKTLRQTDEINVFIDRYLSTFEKLECDGEIYYYNAKADFTIFQYMANNDGLGFINTIYIGYHDGKYCG